MVQEEEAAEDSPRSGAVRAQLVDETKTGRKGDGASVASDASSDSDLDPAVASRHAAARVELLTHMKALRAYGLRLRRHAACAFPTGDHDDLGSQPSYHSEVYDTGASLITPEIEALLKQENAGTQATARRGRPLRPRRHAGGGVRAASGTDNDDGDGSGSVDSGGTEDPRVVTVGESMRHLTISTSDWRAEEEQQQQQAQQQQQQPGSPFASSHAASPRPRTTSPSPRHALVHGERPQSPLTRRLEEEGAIATARTPRSVGALSHGSLHGLSPEARQASAAAEAVREAVDSTAPPPHAPPDPKLPSLAPLPDPMQSKEVLAASARAAKELKRGHKRGVEAAAEVTSATTATVAAPVAAAPAAATGAPAPDVSAPQATTSSEATQEHQEQEQDTTKPAPPPSKLGGKRATRRGRSFKRAHRPGSRGSSGGRGSRAQQRLRSAATSSPSGGGGGGSSGSGGGSGVPTAQRTAPPTQVTRWLPGEQQANEVEPRHPLDRGDSSDDERQLRGSASAHVAAAAAAAASGSATAPLVVPTGFAGDSAKGRSGQARRVAALELGLAALEGDAAGNVSGWGRGHDVVAVAHAVANSPRDVLNAAAGGGTPRSTASGRGSRGGGTSSSMQKQRRSSSGTSSVAVSQARRYLPLGGAGAGTMEGMSASILTGGGAAGGGSGSASGFLAAANKSDAAATPAPAPAPSMLDMQLKPRSAATMASSSQATSMGVGVGMRQASTASSRFFDLDPASTNTLEIRRDSNDGMSQN